MLAGVEAASEVYRQVDPAVALDWDVTDGSAIAAGTTLGRLRGSMRSVLLGERVALNLLSHCSGIATLTRRCVTAVGDDVRIRDTRKTLPGLRALQKAAVRAGGGFNHRDSLSDAVLIKDNHLAGCGITEAVARARARWPGASSRSSATRSNKSTKRARPVSTSSCSTTWRPSEVRAAVDLLGGRVPGRGVGRRHARLAAGVRTVPARLHLDRRARRTRRPRSTSASISPSS